VNCPVPQSTKTDANRVIGNWRNEEVLKSLNDANQQGSITTEDAVGSPPPPPPYTEPEKPPRQTDIRDFGPQSEKGNPNLVEEKTIN
jgi:hypothetical protein